MFVFFVGLVSQAVKKKEFYCTNIPGSLQDVSVGMPGGRKIKSWADLHGIEGPRGIHSLKLT